MKLIRVFLIAILSTVFISNLFAQSDSLIVPPQSYELGGYTVSGTKYLDQDILKTYTGLVVGQKITIPGDDISKAISALWKQGLFANIQVKITNIVGSTAFLDIQLTERPRLGKWTYRGIGKGDGEDLNKKIQLIKGKVFTENLKTNSIQSIKDYYFEKGYTAVDVKCFENKDSLTRNTINLLYIISKGHKVKIEDIYFVGNSNISSSKLKRLMKDTKERARLRPLTKTDLVAISHFSPTKFCNGIYHLTLPQLREEMWNRFRLNVFSASKYRKEDFEGDKQKIIENYNSKGFRDAECIGDTSYKNEKNNLVLFVKINEGKKYYYRNIYWKGNTKYSDKELASVLGIKRGDVYNRSELDSKLNMNQNSTDVSSL
ncbi:MAG: hypothetical protein RL708_1408, partial [Bacteroidota bacterium]